MPRMNSPPKSSKPCHVRRPDRPKRYASTPIIEARSSSCPNARSVGRRTGQSGTRPAWPLPARRSWNILITSTTTPNKGNVIAVVSDGTRVLGLGDIGPEAGLPVMEGKALLFKYLGGVDAVPLCLRTRHPDEFIRTVKVLEPSFGGINLEDIAQPKCFRILDTLRAEMSIPVWHDDQQGTATVLLAGLLNALKVVGKALGQVKIVLVGMGAANGATYRLLKAAGADPAGVVVCDSKGTLHRGRHDLEERQDE